VFHHSRVQWVLNRLFTHEPTQEEYALMSKAFFEKEKNLKGN